MLKYIIISARPKQWYKNVLVFACILFSANILDISMWTTPVLAFIYFCMMSAGEYILNDIWDLERDKSHPIKRLRPIASGQLEPKRAFLVAILLIASALLGAYFTISLDFFIISVIFIMLVILYSLFLKHIAIADVLVISIGFVIRATAGCIALDLFPSSWLIICAFLLALFLALEKRRYELIILSEDASNHRASLNEYSVHHVELLIGITCGSLIVAYIMYTFDTEFEGMLLTVPFVIYGMFRYLYLAHQKGVRAEPDVVLIDRAMLINISLWIVTQIGIILYHIWH